ncbi:MAG: hypothetical protein NTZ97_02655 [Candidatus Moranbacteria bacterium]|nr:hypothetical protein [Candidatus Moranbacteria bacterium]
MSIEKPKMPSLKKMAEIQKERTKSDAKLLDGGAEYKFDKNGSPVLKLTKDQIEFEKSDKEEKDKIKQEENKKNELDDMSPEEFFGESRDFARKFEVIPIEKEGKKIAILKYTELGDFDRSVPLGFPVSIESKEEREKHGYSPGNFDLNFVVGWRERRDDEYYRDKYSYKHQDPDVAIIKTFKILGCSRNNAIEGIKSPVPSWTESKECKDLDKNKKITTEEYRRKKKEWKDSPSGKKYFEWVAQKEKDLNQAIQNACKKNGIRILALNGADAWERNFGAIEGVKLVEPAIKRKKQKPDLEIKLKEAKDIRDIFKALDFKRRGGGRPVYIADNHESSKFDTDNPTVGL